MRFVDGLEEIQYDKGGYKFSLTRTEYGALMRKENGDLQKMYINLKGRADG